MFRDGKPDQLVDDSGIGARLNLDLGKQETTVVDLPGSNDVESAVLPSDILILRQTGAEVPTVLKGITSVEFTDFEGAQAVLEKLAGEGKQGGVAFVASNITNEDEWDKLFRAYKITGIRMTTNTVATMNRMSRSDMGALIAIFRSQQIGLVLETGLEERTNGQRRLFLDA